MAIWDVLGKDTKNPAAGCDGAGGDAVYAVLFRQHRVRALTQCAAYRLARGARWCGNSTQPIVIRPDQPTLASMLRGAGYRTACIGNEVGTPDNFTNPNDVGFDHFYGYINMWHAHNFYPEFLIRNGKVEKLRNEVALRWKAMAIPNNRWPAAAWR